MEPDLVLVVAHFGWGFSLLLAELMIGTLQMERDAQAFTEQFQSPISGVNDWNLIYSVASLTISASFQSPISGVNDWNTR